MRLGSEPVRKAGRLYGTAQTYGGSDMTIDVIVSGIVAIAALVAAGFWLWSALTPVPDNQDTFIAALQYAGRLNSLAALSAAIGAICRSILFARGVW